MREDYYISQLTTTTKATYDKMYKSMIFMEILKKISKELGRNTDDYVSLTDILEHYKKLEVSKP
jgi:ATP-dependent Lon protease